MSSPRKVSSGSPKTKTTPPTPWAGYGTSTSPSLPRDRHVTVLALVSTLISSGCRYPALDKSFLTRLCRHELRSPQSLVSPATAPPKLSWAEASFILYELALVSAEFLASHVAGISASILLARCTITYDCLDFAISSDFTLLYVSPRLYVMYDSIWYSSFLCLYCARR